MSYMIKNPDVLNLKKAFDRDTQFRIPAFQRDYAWGQDEIDEFFSDVKTSVDSNTQHFFGTYVTSDNAPGDVVAQGEEVKFVIDGQQRLTTSILLVAAARHLISETAANYPQALTKVTHLDSYLHIGIDDEPRQPRVFANRDNQTFLSQILTQRSEDVVDVNSLFRNLPSSLRPHSRKILNAYGLLRKRLSSELASALQIQLTDENENVISLIPEPERLQVATEFLNNFIKKFLTNAVFVEIGVSDWQESFALFDGLNNRGLDLAKRDIVKNVVLARNTNDILFSQLTNRWKNIEALMPENKFTKFLRHYLLLSYPDITLKNSVRKFIKHCDGRNAEQIISIIEKAGAEYRKLLMPEIAEERPNVREQLRRLNVLAAERTYPIALAAKLVSVSQTNEVRLLRALETLYFRRSAICQMDNKAMETKIQEIASNLVALGDAGIESAIQGLREFQPTDEEFVTQFKLKRDIDPSIARYLLMEIENHLSGGHPITTTTLEHIMPQDCENWTLSDVDKDNFDNLINRLGNLTILTASDNSSIKNAAFSAKKAFYEEENLKINQYVLAAENWDSEMIENRQLELSHHVLDLWPIL